MLRRLVAGGTLAAIVALLSAPGLAAGPGSIEGRWVLVQQHYGKGQSELAPAERQLRLEIAVEGGQLSGRVWAGDEESDAVAWPGIAMAGVAPPVRVRDLQASPSLDTVRAVYTVEPMPGDGLVLEITEEYRVTADGAALEGSAKVSLVKDGKPAGSYVLHRRFERQP